MSFQCVMSAMFVFWLWLLLYLGLLLWRERGRRPRWNGLKRLVNQIWFIFIPNQLLLAHQEFSCALLLNQSNHFISKVLREYIVENYSNWTRGLTVSCNWYLHHLKNILKLHTYILFLITLDSKLVNSTIAIRYIYLQKIIKIF